ncbi:MAG: hypothetical protein ACK2UK_18530 [Candidatus Promineifilaceae bacterium]
MLESLRLRVQNALENVDEATLSSSGPGGIQAGFFPCQAGGLTMYFLVPSYSDILFNLESEPAVVVTTPRWQLEGEAEVCDLAQAPADLDLVRSPRAAGCALVAVRCRRIHLNWPEGWGYRESIDCNQATGGRL